MRVRTDANQDGDQPHGVGFTMRAGATSHQLLAACCSLRSTWSIVLIVDPNHNTLHRSSLIKDWQLRIRRDVFALSAGRSTISQLFYEQSADGDVIGRDIRLAGSLNRTVKQLFNSGTAVGCKASCWL